MNSSIRRHGMLNTSSLFLGFLIVLGLYSWLVQLERKLEVLNAVLRHASSTGQEATPMLQVDNDVELLETDFTGSISDLEPLGDERAVQEPLLPDLAASISSTVNEAVQAAGESVDPQSHGDDSGGSIPQPGNVEGSPIRGDSSPDNSTDPNLAALSASEITPSEDLSYDCSAFPGASDVLLVIKTGATEIFSKLPTHLLTTLNCVPDFMVFSDMAQQIGSLEIYDALASISDKWKVEDGTLSTLYPKLKDYHSKGLEVTGLGKEGAWELDKWKNVPMAIGAWKKYPEKKWFVFIDADSAILWSNLLLWLGTQDASQPLYYGSPVYIGQTTFAHGGSGYVLSGAAAKILVDLEPEKKEEWEKRTSEVCCGDQMLAEALNSGGIHIANANPIIQGLTPRSVDYDEWHWCKAPVTFHHLTTAEVEELWRWEQGQLREKGREAPVLYSELFYNFAGRQLLTTTEPTSGAVLTFPERNRTNWDNMSGGLDFIPSQEELDSNTFGPYSSAEACVGMCTSQPDCLQWKWRPGKCKLGKLPNLGRRPFAYWDPGNGDNTEELMSGWIEERIREYVKKLGECDLGKAFSA